LKSTVICSTLYEQSDCMGTDKKFVPVRVKLREDPWSRRHRGWSDSAPAEIDISDGEWLLFDISSVSSRRFPILAGAPGSFNLLHW